jgi:hypothetical protein
MKRILSLALAGALATGAIATLTTPAAAGGWSAGAFVGGTVLGLALGTSFGGPPPPPPVYYYAPPPVAYYAPPAYPGYAYADHLAWCRAHYAGYDPHTDTFLGADGIVYRCVGPY